MNGWAFVIFLGNLFLACQKQTHLSSSSRVGRVGLCRSAGVCSRPTVSVEGEERAAPGKGRLFWRPSVPGPKGCRWALQDRVHVHHFSAPTTMRVAGLLYVCFSLRFFHDLLSIVSLLPPNSASTGPWWPVWLISRGDLPSSASVPNYLILPWH